MDESPTERGWSGEIACAANHCGATYFMTIICSGKVQKMVGMRGMPWR
ncbi:hypothetical protein SK92_00708 [Klebsiella oxytoca]|nr:hypothetical protein SK92_00708 [Klebsiella oxytoca]